MQYIIRDTFPLVHSHPSSSAAGFVKLLGVYTVDLSHSHCRSLPATQPCCHSDKHTPVVGRFGIVPRRPAGCADADVVLGLGSGDAAVMACLVDSLAAVLARQQRVDPLCLYVLIIEVPSHSIHASCNPP